jgi:hypothetical protein
MGMCFSIMPFCEEFTPVSATICGAAGEAGMGYVRGDHHKKSGVIMAQVIDSIRSAEVIVADITGHNANVMYELGIAHQLMGPERVVILTQSEALTQIFDLHQFRQFKYSLNDLDALKRELPGLLKAAREARHDLENWKVICGRLERTSHIVSALNRVLGEGSSKGFDGLVIRTYASLSSLAISDHEPDDPELGVPYHDALLEERNSLRSLLARGAHLRAVLNPPRAFTEDQMPERLKARYQRLIHLLEMRSHNAKVCDEDQQDFAAIKNCEFTLSPVPMPNLLIIGNVVAYEGMKRRTSRGFEKTHCESDPNAVAEMIAEFDRVFHASAFENQQTHPPDGRLLERLKKYFFEADSAVNHASLK